MDTFFKVADREIDDYRSVKQMIYMSRILFIFASNGYQRL